jgi:hypothetical protein
MTGRAYDIHDGFQNFKIIGGRYPAKGFPLNHYPILEQLLAVGMSQQLSFCGEATLDLSCALYPAFVSCHFMADQCSVFQFNFDSVL